MSIEIIDILKPKNGLSFKLIEDIDIAVQGYTSLADAVSHFVTTESIQQIINAALSGKQDKLTTAQLTAVNSGITSELVAQISLNTTAIAGKADAADLTALSATVEGKADVADLTALETEIDGKADSSDLTTATASLQAQIDNIVSGSTADSEVINARVDTEGTSHVTLKARIDSTETKLNNYMENTNDIILYISTNRFNPALQTSETIDPHYYVDGVPYSTTEFDSQYNCTAPFEIEPNKQYTIGLVPAVVYDGSNIVKPWGAAASGIFFYDSSMNYISGSSNNTFTTPATAAYARFNYNKGKNVTLTAVQDKCVLVYGSTLPANYVSYYQDSNVRNKISALETDTQDINANIDDVRSLGILSESVNQFIPQQSLTTGGYLKNGQVVVNANYGYTDYIDIEGGLEYIIGLVPAFGFATTPWIDCPVALEFYDSSKAYISDLNKTTGSFVTPYKARYIRVNCDVHSGIIATLVNARAMLVKGDTVPESYSGYAPTTYIKDSISGLSSNVAFIDNEIHFVTDNLYDASLQTPETISPHYYVNGVPYSSTQFDSEYNCTALIEIESSTEYTIAVVPEVNDKSKPWGAATHGGFFYTINNEYISGFNTNTFTTPANAKYIRFNYAIKDGINLGVLNSRCMLVKGSSIPETYEPYENCYIKDKVAEIEAEITNNTLKPNINYIIDNDGNGVSLITKYDKDHDLAVHLKKKGGNNLFDFHSIGTIINSSKDISATADGATNFIASADDWHAPFMVGARENADGDSQSETFTGGNHQYNNQGSGSTPTARGVLLKFYADNMEVTAGSGGCMKFEMIWTNLVQGYNTKKTDGSGREILQENHRLIFDGNKFDDYVDIIPLENVHMNKWYGFQWKSDPYQYIRYIGGVNRGLYDALDASSESGDKYCTNIRANSAAHEIVIDIDKDYDLGDKKFYSGEQGAFTATYGKGYFFIISETNLTGDSMYSLHGSYQFIPHVEAEIE